MGALLPPYNAAHTETPQGHFNINAATLPKWRAAIAKVRAGTARGRIVLCGDSTTAGAQAGSGGTLNYNGAFAKNYPRAFGVLLNKAVTTSDNSFICDQAQNVAYGTYDPRVTLGTGWTAAQSSISGNMFKFTTGGGSGTLAFTPAGQIDTIKVVYYTTTGQGTMAVNVDGGSTLATVNAGAAGNVVTTQTISCTKGSHTINMVANNNGNIFMLGIIAYDSTAPAVDLVQCGASGSKAITWDNNSFAWSPLTVMPILAPDLFVLNLTINDSNTPTDLATYTSQMQAIITQMKTTSDVLLMVGAPSSTTQATNGTLDSYVSALKSLAVSNGIGLLNIKTRWVSYAVTNPLLPYGDTLHPTSPGYQDIALALANALNV